MILASASWSALPLTSVGLAALACASYAGSALANHRISHGVARWLMLLAIAMHGLLLVWTMVGPDPRFGFAPALSFTAWLLSCLYAVEGLFYPPLRLGWVLSVVAVTSLGLGLIYPGHELQASASAWLGLHWALGIASYGLLAAAAWHAWLMNRAEQQIRQATASAHGLPLMTLERLTFRFLWAGFVLLSATLLAGWVFGEASYGQAWRWDHKTLFSLLSWFTLATLLVGRARFGWRGRMAARMVYTAALLLLLAYVGSRFVLEVLLERLT